jgi:hypothetical protein
MELSRMLLSEATRKKNEYEHQLNEFNRLYIESGKLDFLAAQLENEILKNDEEECVHKELDLLSTSELESIYPHIAESNEYEKMLKKLEHEMDARNQMIVDYIERKEQLKVIQEQKIIKETEIKTMYNNMLNIKKNIQ